MTTRYTFLLALLCAACPSASMLRAQVTHSFIGPSTGPSDYNNASIWSAGSVPNTASTFIRLNNNGADARGATVQYAKSADLTVAGFELNSLSANLNVTTYGYSFKLAPDSAYTSTIAQGRTLTVSNLMGNANATVNNSGNIVGGFLDSVNITNSGGIQASFQTVTISNSHITQTSSGVIGGPSATIQASTVSGGTILASNNGTTQYKGATVQGSSLSGSGIQYVTGTAASTFDGIRLNSGTAISIFDSQATAVFKGTSFINSGIANTNSGGGTITLDNGTLVGGFVSNARTINGTGTFNNTQISNSSAGKIVASAGDIHYQRAFVFGGHLAGNNVHVVEGSSSSDFSAVTIDAGATLRMASGAAASFSGTINGSWINQSTAFNAVNVGSGTIVNGTGTLTNNGYITVGDSQNGAGQINVGSLVNHNQVFVIDGSFNGAAIDNTGGRLRVDSFGSKASFNTAITGGTIEADSFSTLTYHGGSLNNVTLFRGNHVVDGNMTFNGGKIDQTAVVTINNGVTALFHGTVTNNGTINGNITLDAGGVLAGFGTVNGTVTSNLNSGGNVSVSSLAVGGSGNGHIDTVNIALDSHVTSGDPVNIASNGTLNIDAGSVLTAPDIAVSGALHLNGEVEGNIHLGAGGTLSGSGTVHGTVFASDGSIISIGNSPGQQDVDSFAFGSGTETFKFEINSADGVAGANWDLLNVDGLLSFDSGTILLKLFSLTNTNQGGDLADFQADHAYHWLFAQAGSVSGTPTFVMDATGFQNQLAGGAFSWHQAGTDFYIDFTPADSSQNSTVPEPSTLLLVSVGLMIGLGCRARVARAAL